MDVILNQKARDKALKSMIMRRKTEKAKQDAMQNKRLSVQKLPWKEDTATRASKILHYVMTKVSIYLLYNVPVNPFRWP